MESLSFQTVLDWVSQHSAWAPALVFFIALSESLVVLGLIMPGAVLLFGVGAFVGTGALPLWPVMIAATLGAMAGDGVSYWVGRHFKTELRSVWPFRSYPALVSRGVEFFNRHGGKSVAMGRFIGPLRPVVPAVAGMLEMPVRRYAAINLLASLAWAPVYLLPGVAFGTSLQLASEVAGRLVLFLLLTLSLLWFTAWLLGRIWRLLTPRTYFLVQRVLMWTRGHPIMGALPASLLDPEHPEARGLTLLALILSVATTLFLLVTPAVTGGPLLSNMDQLVFHSLQRLRTPWADSVMVFVTGLGDTPVLGAVVLLVAGWLAWKRHWRAVAHWLAAALAAQLMASAIKLTTGVERPPAVTALADGYAFPSGHATVGMAVYGFLAVMLARELPYRLHMAVYTLTGLGVATIGFSRLYLGAHWLSDVIGGLSLGLAWIALLGIAYRTHLPRSFERHRQLAIVALLALALALALNAAVRYPENRVTYALPYADEHMAAADWWHGDWARLPDHRSDLRGQRDYPLTLQWAGSAARIRETLRRLGWQESVWEGTMLLHWFHSNAAADEIPVLPQVHQGRHESLRMVRPAGEPDRLQVLRLRQSDITLDGRDGHQPLWLGSMTYLHPVRMLGLSVLRTEPDRTVPVAQLTADLDPDVWDTQELTGSGKYTATVALIRPAADAPGHSSEPSPGPLRSPDSDRVPGTHPERPSPPTNTLSPDPSPAYGRGAWRGAPCAPVRCEGWARNRGVECAPGAARTESKLSVPTASNRKGRCLQPRRPG